jgi:hypothetical protein
MVSDVFKLCLGRAYERKIRYACSRCFFIKPSVAVNLACIKIAVPLKGLKRIAGSRRGQRRVELHILAHAHGVELPGDPTIT